MCSYTISDDNLEKILFLFNKRKPTKIEIFKLHNLGESKYKDLGMISQDYGDHDLTDKEVDYVYNFFKSRGFNIEIINL